jgi:hypothetical protein
MVSFAELITPTRTSRTTTGASSFAAKSACSWCLHSLLVEQSSHFSDIIFVTRFAS